MEPTPRAIDYRQKITPIRPRTSTTRRYPANIVAETESDRGRIIQSAAIRRLQQKTQVYPLETNAAVRSRLTHSLEVQQTGRYLAKTILSRLKKQNQLTVLGLDHLETAFTNLVEMSCLMHDVGNPPMGHFGEATISRWLTKYLPDCCRQALRISHINQTSPFFQNTLLPDLCVFEGNAQGLRIIHTLHQLNLTFSQSASLIKYTRGAWQPRPHFVSAFSYRHKKPGFYFSERNLIERMGKKLDINEGCRFPLVYIMEAADDIAYCIADLEDALDKGILSIAELQYHLHTVWKSLGDPNDCYLPDIIQSASREEKNDSFIIRLRTRLVKDLVEYSATRYITQHDAIFHGTFDEPLIDGSSPCHRALETLKAVAVRYVFNQREKETPELRGYSALSGLLTLFKPLLSLPQNAFEDLNKVNDSPYFIEQRLYHRLSKKYKAAYHDRLQQTNYRFPDKNPNELEWYYRVRLIVDYISGMTDHFVVSEYQSLSAI
ncbi:Deoxyguanosinetriphosphate triphosphohydrolase [invertebrate metagenome]|uniref:Deoxyguanosinetriphosphate triphosphohydrolase n=1 Tax=invertebrate metagenome TaxID=1711999 RepID=A0A2H9T772_9ZZZZ